MPVNVHLNYLYKLLLRCFNPVFVVFRRVVLLLLLSASAVYYFCPGPHSLHCNLFKFVSSCVPHCAFIVVTVVYCYQNGLWSKTQVALSVVYCLLSDRIRKLPYVSRTSSFHQIFIMRAYASSQKYDTLIFSLLVHKSWCFFLSSSHDSK